MSAAYQPKHLWKRTQIDEKDPPTDFDWIGYDGDGAVGRVRKEHHGPIKGKWQWAGWTPRNFKGSPITPNLGYAASCRLAMQQCEQYWDAIKALRSD